MVCPSTLPYAGGLIKPLTITLSVRDGCAAELCLVCTGILPSRNPSIGSCRTHYQPYQPFVFNRIPHMPEAIYLSMPLTKWVQGTIAKMTAARTTQLKDWSRYWIQTYMELGGTSCEHLTTNPGSGDKRCPMHAAYGLWRLGRIKGSEKLANFTLQEVDQRYGPNAAYAVLVLDLLENDQAASHWTHHQIWSSVSDSYQRQLGRQPALTRQGALRNCAGLSM